MPCRLVKCTPRGPSRPRFAAAHGQSIGHAAVLRGLRRVARLLRLCTGRPRAAGAETIGPKPASFAARDQRLGSWRLGQRRSTAGRSDSTLPARSGAAPALCRSAVASWGERTSARRNAGSGPALRRESGLGGPDRRDVPRHGPDRRLRSAGRRGGRARSANGSRLGRCAAKWLSAKGGSMTRWPICTGRSAFNAMTNAHCYSSPKFTAARIGPNGL